MPAAPFGVGGYAPRMKKEQRLRPIKPRPEDRLREKMEKKGKKRGRLARMKDSFHSKARDVSRSTRNEIDDDPRK
jgi:hypothetical protein